MDPQRLDEGWNGQEVEGAPLRSPPPSPPWLSQEATSSVGRQRVPALGTRTTQEARSHGWGGHTYAWALDFLDFATQPSGGRRPQWQRLPFPGGAVKDSRTQERGQTPSKKEVGRSFILGSPPGHPRLFTEPRAGRWDSTDIGAVLLIPCLNFWALAALLKMTTNVGASRMSLGPG